MPILFLKRNILSFFSMLKKGNSLGKTSLLTAINTYDVPSWVKYKTGFGNPNDVCTLCTQLVYKYMKLYHWFK